jgi:STE24 endopeptidase
MDEPKRYETIKNLSSLGGFILDAVILVYLIVSGWTIRIRQFAESITDSEFLIVLIYIVIVGGALKLIELPLSFYSGYVVEHKFGLSRETHGSWAKDEVKALAVAASMGIVSIEIIYYLMRAYPQDWWIYAAAIFVAFFVVITNLSPVLLLPLFFKFTPVDDPDLNRRVASLASRTGTRVCGIFEWSLSEKTRKANAAVVGWGNTRRIIVSDTLLRNFSGEEIEVIMAHELCHHAKHHMWLAIALQAVLTVGGFYAVHRILLPLSGASGFQSISDIAGFPLFALIVATLSLLVLPAVNYFSRRLETAADLYALELTGDSLAFVSSMEKLGDLNLSDKAPNKIIEFIFHSHPSIERRIKLAADRVGQSV